MFVPMTMKAFLLLALAAGAVPLAATGALAAETADVLLYNGKIVTVDRQFSIHSAIAITDGKIAAVGGNEIVSRYPAARRIDLRGRSVLPGFIDAHLHIFGHSHRQVDLRNVTSIAQIKSAVSAKARELGSGEWVVGNYWDETNLVDRRPPLRADLDAAAPDNPVVLIRSGGHSTAANSLALQAAGVARDTKDTAQHVFEREANGEPNGIVREAVALFMSLVPPDTPQQMRASYVAEIRKVLGVGITSMGVAGGDLVTQQRPMFPMPSWPEWQSIYGEFGNELPRAVVQVGYPGAEVLESFPHRTGFGDDRLKLGAIGEGPAVDGGFSGPTACTSRDYKGQPGFRGRCLLTPEKLQSMADVVARTGWQLGLHTMGDAAIDQAVAAYERALRSHPQRDPRWFTGHFGMLPSERTLQLMAKNRIYASAQPNFLYTLEQRYLDNVEGEALAHINPVATPHRRGVLVAFGGDTLPTDPRVGLYAAVTRKGKSGHSIAPTEAVSIQDAIRMYTANPAYLTWDEEKKGTLEVGKFADMIVLDRDPLTCPPDELLKMQVDLTIVGGRILWSSPAQATSDLLDTSGPMTHEKFARYVRLFNDHDLRFVDFYTPDVVFDKGSDDGVLRGRQAIADWYRDIWADVDQNITVGALAIDSHLNVVMAEILTTLDARRDAVQRPGMTLGRGDRLVTNGTVVYTLENGLIKSLRGAVKDRYVERAKK
jgi:predicted amidohydrolase YtcJ